MKDHRRAGMPSPYPAAIARRLVTVPVSWLLFVLAVLLAAPVTVAALVIDLTLRRRGWPTVRMAVFVVRALWIEVSSHPLILWSWLTQPLDRTSWTERNHHLMHWWVGRLVRGAERVVGVRWRFDIPDELGPGPLLAFCQHVSVVDAVVPVHILGNQRGWYLRYALTRGLRFDPCLDIVGHRIPNHFVVRGTGGDERELAPLRTLVSDMDVDEAGVIFPGGGLFTPAGLGRAVEKLTERGSPEAAAARAYRHVMPPRPGGVNTFLDAAPEAHVLVVGHVGFEPLASIRRLWSVLPLTEPVEVRVWRYDRSEVPTDGEARMAWLYEKWTVMDDWIDARMQARAAEAAVPA